MKNKLLPTIIIFLFSTRLAAQMPDFLQKYSVQELMKTKDRWREFLNSGTMHAGIYQLKKRETGEKKIYAEDGAFYILGSSGKLRTDSGDVVINKGEVLYIKAGCETQFVANREKLVILEIFSMASTTQDSKGFVHYSQAQEEQLRNPAQNAWNPFLRSKTMVFGLYMLPKKIGGDSTLTHPVDELNYVTSGSGKFTVDNYTMDVKEGDIVFVGKTHGHYFHDLNSDFDVLIFWEKRSLMKK